MPANFVFDKVFNGQISLSKIQLGCVLARNFAEKKLWMPVNESHFFNTWCKIISRGWQSLFQLVFLYRRLSTRSEWRKIKEGELPTIPSIYRGTFGVTGEPKDTFLHMKSWTKGVCFVNGHNLGRYWNIGPQETLYLPAPWLRKGENEVDVLNKEYGKLCAP